MPLPIPELDDRSYQDLLDNALDRIRRDLNTEWNDLSAGDPGVVLLEAFAFLTEQMLYRLNRLPEKAYVAFLSLLGISLDPPTAARARLRFERAHAEPGSQPININLPAGTRIVPGGGNDDKLANAFVLANDLEMNSDGPFESLAYHCEQVEEELGISNGMPGQSFPVQRPPLIARLDNGLDLVVGVEVPPKEQRPGDREDAEKRVYRLWQEVERFSLNDLEAEVYTVDRTLGVIQFAPAIRKFHKVRKKGKRQQFTLLGAIPPAGRHIRIWYSRGGGEAGNLPKDVLTEILDLPSRLLAAGLTVTNPDPAWGGADGETLSNALVRGPHEFFARGNVVTAHDYEQLVLRKIRSIARTKAYARRTLWTYAQPGTVEIVLVPSLSSAERQSITLETLKNKERVDDLKSIWHELETRSPLGTRFGLVWARYKKVWVEAELVVKQSATISLEERQKRIEESLNRLLSPLALEHKTSSGLSSDNHLGVLSNGWPFGQELRLAQVYQHILTIEPDITLIRNLSLKIEEAPDRDVRCLAADYFQPDTWYAASAQRLFRSRNNGLGWEKVLSFEADGPATADAGRLFTSEAGKNSLTWVLTKERRLERVWVVCPSPDQPGVVAVATRLENSAGPAPNHGASALYATADCGETWYQPVSYFDGQIEDLAWLPRGNRHILLLATNSGLYELDMVFPVTGEPDLTLSGDPPVGPAPDERAEILMPRLVPIDPYRLTLPLYAVAVISKRGNARVAVAAKNRQGIFLSRSDDLIPADRTNNDVRKTDGNSGKESQNNRQTLAQAAANAQAALEAYIRSSSKEETLGEQYKNRIQTLVKAAADTQAALEANSQPSGQKGSLLNGENHAGSNFEYLGLGGEDVRHLNVQKYNDETFLWAAAMAVGDVAHGCYYWQFDVNLLPDSIVAVEDGWFDKDKGWSAGSCHALAFQGADVLAATASGGILMTRLEPKNGRPGPWKPAIGANLLPRRIRRLDQEPDSADKDRAGSSQFSPLFALASNDSAASPSNTRPILMTGDAAGVYRRVQEETTEDAIPFEKVSRSEFRILRDAVTLPQNWLFVSGPHQVTIVPEEGEVDES